MQLVKTTTKSSVHLLIFTDTIHDSVIEFLGVVILCQLIIMYTEKVIYCRKQTRK